MIMTRGEYLRIAYTANSPSEDAVHRPLPFAASPVLQTRIVSARCLTSGDDVKTTYDLALDKTNIEWDFQAGDAIGILPENHKLEVEWILSTLDLDEIADDTYELSLLEEKRNAKIPLHLPPSGTLRTLFHKYLDIRSVPKKTFLKHLASYTAEDTEKEELLSLADPKQAIKYTNFIRNEQTTLFALLQRFPSCKPPIERLLEHLPALKPRFYSLSSSSHSSLNEFHITFSVIEAKTENPEFSYASKGVCTGYLENLIETNLKAAMISFYFRTNSKFLMFDDAVNYTLEPIILIAAGVGFAPFKGFLDDNFIRRGDIYLFFGCRYAERDFLYKDQVNQFVEKGVLKKVFTAFSREAKHKCYVQDAIRMNGKLVVKLLCEQNAFVRLCGDVKQLMQSVDEAFIDVLVTFAHFDAGQAVDFLAEIKRTRRYCSDIWN